MSVVQTEIISIGRFLENRNLKIPYYQRPYKWTVHNVVQLLDDIQRFSQKEAYRIGTVVIFNEEDDCFIVDGQQRAVTFLLILRAIAIHKAANITDHNLKDYIYLLEANKFVPGFTSEVSIKNIQDNYREIERRVMTLDEPVIDFLLNKCQITLIQIDNISEAFQFFDSQNARGKDLEPHDLLKAFHLRELQKSHDTITENEVAELVDTWEEMEIKELATLFADFLFRVRGWCSGNSSRYFTKKDTRLFKGINLTHKEKYPYTQIFRFVDEHIGHSKQNGTIKHFPFQLDQTIINGQYFFEMITHYKKIYDQVENDLKGMSGFVGEIINTINTYEGRTRTGDKYVRMLFNCAVLYYMDKFGRSGLEKAIEKIFIWAYSLRLTYQSLQLASVDNYVIEEFNLFKKIKEAVYKEDILTINIPLVKDDFESEKTEAIKELFISMKYLAHV